MSTEFATTQIPKYFMTWTEVFLRVGRLIQWATRERKAYAYGVPRGGGIVAGLLGMAGESVSAVMQPDAADFLVDDVIDSGRTRQRYNEAYPHKHFVALVDRNEPDDAKLGWVVFPWEQRADGSEEGPEENITRLIEYLGEDPERPGLANTPSRVVRAFEEMTAGYRMDYRKLLAKTFDLNTDEMVVLKGIRFSSLCEHHLLPFAGIAAIGYLPDPTRLLGISKLARVVECFARRLQVQERLTVQIAHAIDECVGPLGVGVVIEAHHNCMGCRGVRQPDARMITSCMLGLMRDNPQARAELLGFLGG